VPDLSQLLDDLYGDLSEPVAEPTAEPVAEPAAGALRRNLPDWADEDVLDAAFADWVPGPPAGACNAERSILSDLSELAALSAPSVPMTGTSVLTALATTGPTAPPPAPLPLAPADREPDDLDADPVAPASWDLVTARIDAAIEGSAPVSRESWAPANDDILPKSSGKIRLRLRK
jgi:hypothetical protein